jgi:probable F420-dependent oxidoreductase
MSPQIAIPVPNISAPAGVEPITRVAQLCDEVGVHSVWLGDHIVWPTRAEEQRRGEALSEAKYAGNLFEPLVTAGFIAGVTESVRIGIGILVVPYRNPLVAAKMVCTADQLSGGRLILGVGGGYVDGEFRALGLEKRKLGAQVEDFVGLIRAIERDDEPVFHGQLLDVEDVRFLPGPAQRPFPLWIGGMTERSLRRAVEIGDGWHGAGLGFDEVKPLVDRIAELMDEHGRAREELTLSNRLRVRFADRPGGDTAERPAPSRYWDLPPHIEGPPEHVAAELGRFAEIGVEHLVLDLHEGSELPELAAAIERLGEEVLPNLADAAR